MPQGTPTILEMGMYKAALAGAVLAAMGTTGTFAQNYETASY
jgi:hypothetical protein